MTINLYVNSNLNYLRLPEGVEPPTDYTKIGFYKTMEAAREAAYHSDAATRRFRAQYPVETPNFELGEEYWGTVPDGIYK